MELSDWLAAHEVDTSRWGVGRAKAVADLWRELTCGDSRLLSGPPRRQVRVVRVLVERDGLALVEVGQRLSTGRVRDRNTPPTEKMKPGESPLAAAIRCVGEELGVAISLAEVAHAASGETVELGSSPSFPGLLTEYILHDVSATVPGLPVGPFRTRESAASDASVSEHYWEWRRI